MATAYSKYTCNVKMANEDEQQSDVTVDDILKILGSFGRANVYNYLLILLPILLSGIYSSVYNFEALDLPYRCSTECNEPGFDFTAPQVYGKPARCVRYALSHAANGTCSPHMFNTSTTVKCNSYVYFEDHSIVKEFNLGCQDWKRSLVGTVHNAGFFISIPLTGFVSDKYGRRIALVFATVTSGIFGVIRGFAVNYKMFMAAEFLETAIGGGVYTAGFVLALELVRPEGRVFVSLLFDTFYIFGGITVTLLYWWLQSWRILLFVIYTPGILVISYLWLLTESFRWLFSRGHYSRGVETLQMCERINRVTIPGYHYEQVQEHAKRQRDAEKLDAKKFNRTSIKQLFMSKMIWKRLMTCAFLWVSSTLGYFGLSINAIELAGNSYTNYIIVLLIEAPANICKFFLLDRFGRKRVIVSAFIMSGIILINYGFIPGGYWSMCFYLAGKFFITLAYNSLYIFAAEVFPTNYRTTMLGLCSTIGRIGSVIAPQTPLLSKYYESLPTLFFGAMATISGFLVLTLPETSKQKLPDSLKEAQDLERVKREGAENKGLVNSDDAT